MAALCGTGDLLSSRATPGSKDHQLMGNLFRTPPLGQQIRNDTAKVLITLHQAGAW
jgi:hypothetical protein